jgi:integrase
MDNAKEVDRTKYLYPKTVKGNPYLYFRMADGALVSLPLDRDSAEFRRSYDACLKQRTAPVVAPRLPERRRTDTANVAFVGNTMGAAIKAYKDSADYVALKSSSKKKYEQALALLSDMLGETRLPDLDIDAVDLYSEQIAKDHGAPVAKFQVSMISNIWKTCRKHKEFGIKKIANPTADAERRYKKPKAPSKPWTDAQRETFMEAAPKSLKLAKLLLHFSAQRGGDCIKMRLTVFDGEGLFVRPEKTSDGDDLEANYHLCPKPLLDALLKRRKEASTPDEHILLNGHGRPWANSNSLSWSIRTHMIKVGLAEREKTISMHGLRKNAASEVSALLVGTQGIKSVTGHKSDDQAGCYAKYAAQIALNSRWSGFGTRLCPPNTRSGSPRGANRCGV